MASRNTAQAAILQIEAWDTSSHSAHCYLLINIMKLHTIQGPFKAFQVVHMD